VGLGREGATKEKRSEEGGGEKTRPINREPDVTNKPSIKRFAEMEKSRKMTKGKKSGKRKKGKREEDRQSETNNGEGYESCLGTKL